MYAEDIPKKGWFVMKKRTHLSIRMDPELHDKFKSVSEFEGRSMSRQILYLIRNCVSDFEKENGPIILPEDSSQ